MYENFTEYKTAETATMKCFEDELSDSELLRFRLSLGTIFTERRQGEVAWAGWNAQGQDCTK